MDLFKPNVKKMQDKRDVNGLIKALSYKDADIRSGACSALRIIKDTRAVEPLILLLKDPNESIRREAIYALGELKDPRVADALLQVMSDKSSFPAAAHVLADLKDPRLYDHLVKALEDDDLRVSAVWTMGELGDARGVKLLVPFLTHADPVTRKAAIYALFRFQSLEAIDQLKLYLKEIQSTLKDTDANVRELAIETLGKIPDALEKNTLIELLHDPDISVRQEAGHFLNEIGPPDDLQERAWFAAACRNWPMALELGQIAREPVFLACQSKQDDERVHAAITLAKLGDARAIEPLIACLNLAMAKPDLCVQAIEALGKYGDARAINHLQGLLSNFYEGKIRRAASSALFAFSAGFNKRISKEPMCSQCGKSIPAFNRTIADDIRSSGGMVIGGTGLDEKLYDGVICRKCGTIFCSDCEHAKIKNLICPLCSNHVSPLFADYLRS